MIVVVVGYAGFEKNNVGKILIKLNK